MFTGEGTAELKPARKVGSHENILTRKNNMRHKLSHSLQGDPRFHIVQSASTPHTTRHRATTPASFPVSLPPLPLFPSPSLFYLPLPFPGLLFLTAFTRELLPEPPGSGSLLPFGAALSASTPCRKPRPSPRRCHRSLRAHTAATRAHALGVSPIPLGSGRKLDDMQTTAGLLLELRSLIQ